MQLLAAFRQHHLIKKYPSLKQLIKYGLVGSSTTLIDFLTYFFLTRAFVFFQEQYLLANAGAVFLGISWSFVFNKRWTFRNHDIKKLHHQYFKFWIVTLVGLGLSEIILYLLVDKAGIHDLIAKIITGVVAVWNFCGHKWWTFRFIR